MTFSLSLTLMYNNYWPAFGTKDCQDLDEKIWPYKHWKLLESVSEFLQEHFEYIFPC